MIICGTNRANIQYEDGYLTTFFDRDYSLTFRLIDIMPVAIAVGAGMPFPEMIKTKINAPEDFAGEHIMYIHLGVDGIIFGLQDADLGAITLDELKFITEYDFDSWNHEDGTQVRG